MGVEIFVCISGRRVVDIEERMLMVMDPCEKNVEDDEMCIKHEDNAKLVIKDLRISIHANIAGWHVPATGWKITYNYWMHPSCKM